MQRCVHVFTQKEREDEYVHNTDGCRKKRHRNTADQNSGRKGAYAGGEDDGAGCRGQGRNLREQASYITESGRCGKHASHEDQCKLRRVKRLQGL